MHTWFGMIFSFSKISLDIFSFSNIILLDLFIIVKGIEKFIDISKNEFTVYSMFVLDISFIPHWNVFFALSVPGWKKWHKENHKKVTPIENHAKMKNEKLRH